MHGHARACMHTHTHTQHRVHRCTTPIAHTSAISARKCMHTRKHTRARARMRTQTHSVHVFYDVQLSSLTDLSLCNNQLQLPPQHVCDDSLDSLREFVASAEAQGTAAAWRENRPPVLCKSMPSIEIKQVSLSSQSAGWLCGGFYHTYDICVHVGPDASGPVRVSKRYTEFLNLRSALSSANSDDSVGALSFPPKCLMKWRSAVTQQRSRLLQSWLQVGTCLPSVAL